MKRLFYIFLAIILVVSTLSPLAGAYTQADGLGLEQNIEPLITPTSFITVMDEAELVAEISVGAPVITLGADIYVSGANLSIPADTDIRLEGSFILSRANNTELGSFITVETGASLTIDGVHIEAPAGVTELRGIVVNNGAELILIDGSISGFEVASSSGGGVYVMWDGSFEMYGGAISGNSASSGGGVYIESGNFEMHGGTISGNTAGTGGGVLAAGDTTPAGATLFNMWGGEISGNIATSHGGGVYLVWATFDMWDGKINNNTVDWGTGQYGGGIILDADGILNMHGGEFSGNSAPLGGGIATHGGEFTMYDGRITGNTAELGGGIYDEFFASFPHISTILGGEISGNTAIFGGGMYIELDAFVTVTDAEIMNNTATQGGGIYLAAASVLTVTDTEINGNTAEQGGGIYVVTTAELNVTGASFITNNSAESGGGIYTEAVVDYNALTTADYQNITTASTVVFRGNNASAAFEPPMNADVNYPNIQYASSSIQVAGTYWNPINNLDINYIGTTPFYIVRYFANGGTGTHTDISAEDTVYTVLSNAAAGISRTNYNFTDWNTEADGNGTSYAAGDTITITSNVVLYAQWTPAAVAQHTVTFQTDAGGVLNPAAPVTVGVDIGETLTATQIPTPVPNAGHNFVGWRQGTASPISTTKLLTLPITADTTFAAVFAPNNGGGNGGGTTPPPQLPSRQAYLIGAEGHIHPNANITRAEVATIFFRLISDNMRTANWSQTNSYSDVTRENWFNNAVSTTTQLGIFRGRPDGTFAPNESITRAELAAAAARFMNAAGILDADEDLFSDIYGHWASAYVNAAAMNDWVQGPYGQGGAFYPDRPITRAETAAIINRIFNRLPESTADLLPNMRTWPDNANTGAWYYLYLQAASNSYTFTMRPGSIHERWVALVPVRNWAALERPDSTPTGFY
ncbi:MAG: S-layer homology domain-containing protein [Oscillospiraceae bacterium]|nr:S-layer homology domain-containing protein [Oscillospiraceae bacterium]